LEEKNRTFKTMNKQEWVVWDIKLRQAIEKSVWGQNIIRDKKDEDT